MIGSATGVCRTVGHGVLPAYGLHVDRLSEEHGVIEGPGADQLVVGQKVLVIPNHICPVVNLFNEVVLVRQGVVEATLPVAARGHLQ
jgi:D-serine deaminase-like pyridoxal phosphate-dependent protein